MPLFCGRILLSGSPDAAREEEALSTMLGALAGKGAGEAHRVAHDHACFGGKALTRDEPAEPGMEHLFLDAHDLTITGAVRLDDRASLLAELEQELHGIGTRTDLAIVLAAYLKWGRGCPLHLYGDYAFAIRDGRRGSAFLVRDHAGVTPLFYSRTADGLVFGNDLASVAAAPDVPASLDRKVVADFLDTEVTLPVGRTMLSAVRRLPPGHCLHVEADRHDVWRWWNPGRLPQIRYPDEEDYVLAMREHIEAAVAARVPAHGNVGTHVTGGLDSSAVSALAIKAQAARGLPMPAGYTWTPLPSDEEEAGRNEAVTITAFAEASSIELNRVPGTAEDILEYFRRDPVIHPSSNMLFMEIAIQRHAAEQGITTMLSGHGGDQCVSHGVGGLFPELLLGGRIGEFARQSRAAGVHPVRRAASVARGLCQEAAQALSNSKPLWPFTPPGSYKRPAFSRFNPQHRNAPFIALSHRQARVAKVGMGYIDMRVEAWAEHASRRGIAYAYPLLDRRLMEFSFGLPVELFVRNGTSRWIMRRAIEAYVPETVTRNTDKTEAIRSRAMVRSLEAARPDLVQALEALDPASTRAQIVDVARLKHDLEAQPITAIKGKGPQFGRKRAALELLDIQPHA